LAPIDVAHAHYVWLEREVTGPARGYFGSGSTISGKKPAVCSTGSMRREFSRRKRNTGAGQAKQKNLQFAAKGHGDVRFVDSSVPPREDKEKAASPKPSIMPKPAEGKPSPSSTWSWCPLKLAGKICSAVF
jgi:hypothetical protein